MRTLILHQWILVIINNNNQIMINLKTTFSFGISLEARRVKQAVRKSSKVLTVVKEIIRTRLLKKDVVDSG